MKYSCAKYISLIRKASSRQVNERTSLEMSPYSLITLGGNTSITHGIVGSLPKNPKLDQITIFLIISPNILYEKTVALGEKLEASGR